MAHFEFRVGFEGDYTIQLFEVDEDINVCDAIDPFTRISKYVNASMLPRGYCLPL